MMEEIRTAIDNDRFEEYKKNFLERYEGGEIQ